MPADGYLRRVLADGALPFRYRGGVRALLGEPDGPGLLRTVPAAPYPQLSYPRSGWLGEIELPDRIAAMAGGPLDWPAGNDRPRGDRDHGTAAGSMSRGRPGELPGPSTDLPPARSWPAATTGQAPQPETATSRGAAMEVSPAAVPGPPRVMPAELAQAAQPQITESTRHMAAEPTQTAVGSARPLEPRAGPGTDSGLGSSRPTTAAARRGTQPTTSPCGSRELLIPGRTVRSPVMTGSEQIGAAPDPSGPTRQASRRQPGGPLRRSGAELAGIPGREPVMTDSSGDLSSPDPGLTVRRVPPRHMDATAPKHTGGTVIAGGQATPLRAWRPTGPGRQVDIVPVGHADPLPPRRPAPEAGIRTRAEQPSAAPPAAAPVPAPQLIVMLPPRPPTAPPAFWERRRLGRLWSRPLR